MLLVGCKAIKPNYTVIKKNSKRTTITFDKNSIEVDNGLVRYVTEFYDEAFKYGLPVDSIAQKFYGIFYDDPTGGNHGLTGTIENITKGWKFSIVSVFAKQYNRERYIVFHELGHIHYFTHCHHKCANIMSGTVSGAMFYNDWEKQKVIMFKKLTHQVTTYKSPAFMLNNNKWLDNWK